MTPQARAAFSALGFLVVILASVQPRHRGVDESWRVRMGLRDWSLIFVGISTVVLSWSQWA